MAHCPVPVALLFNAKAIAGRHGVRFSDGNLASPAATLGDDVTFLRSLDFEEIYHDGPTRPEETPRLRMRRQAEIIVPDVLPLNDLELVATRSEAERQTLLMLLSGSAWIHSPLIDKVIVESSLFYCRWTFVERVTLTGDQVRFLFNPDSLTPGPFDARIVWTNPATGASTEESASLRGLGHVSLPIPDGFHGPVVQMTVRLDNTLAFAGSLKVVPSSALLGTR